MHLVMQVSNVRVQFSEHHDLSSWWASKHPVTCCNAPVTANCMMFLVLQVAVHPAMQIPDVRVSFLDIMTSLAAGPRGSRFILLQFRTNAASSELEHFTWRKLFQSVVAYCRCALAKAAVSVWIGLRGH
eukprot:GHRR01026663.1.p1 GENE.GHRR01026663.1~~GHRR01026663.1.p1  ORF type:complete len:129 (-),score=23.41 GHRR01026663.1:13-399(-)